VPKGSVYENRFNGFPWFAKETIKMVSQQCPRLSTGLKPGVNETTFEAKPWQICARASNHSPHRHMQPDKENTQ